MEMKNILSWVTDKQVPTVDPADIKALHKFQADLVASGPLPPGQMRAVSHEVVQQLLTPGADIGIVAYRLGWV